MVAPWGQGGPTSTGRHWLRTWEAVPIAPQQGAQIPEKSLWLLPHRKAERTAGQPLGPLPRGGWCSCPVSTRMRGHAAASLSQPPPELSWRLSPVTQKHQVVRTGRTEEKAGARRQSLHGCLRCQDTRLEGAEATPRGHLCVPPHPPLHPPEAPQPPQGLSCCPHVFYH